MDDSARNQQPVHLPSFARPTPWHRGLLAFAGLKLWGSSLLFLVLPSSAFAATVTLAWNASLSGSAVAGYILYYGDASGSYSTDVDVGNTTQAALSGLDEGKTYYFAATAYNVNRNESSFSNEVSYSIPVADAIPPTSVITSPSDGSSVQRKSTVTMTAAASDNVGVVRVEFYVNGQLQCADGSSAYTCTWQVPPSRRRTYQLQAKAFDAHGNVGASSIVTVSAQ
jgi:hypothetical protein